MPRLPLPKPNLKLRMLTLAEMVGVAALVLAGLGYWDTHRDHVDTEAARKAAAATKAAQDSFVLKGVVDKKGEMIRLKPVRADQVVQTQTLFFPKAVRADKIELNADGRIEADDVADGVKKAAQDAGAGRVPVVIETTFVQDGQTRTDRSLYKLAYEVHHRVLLGDRVTLDGLTLARRAIDGDPAAAAEKAWASR